MLSAQLPLWKDASQRGTFLGTLSLSDKDVTSNVATTRTITTKPPQTLLTAELSVVRWLAGQHLGWNQVHNNAYNEFATGGSAQAIWCPNLGDSGCIGQSESTRHWMAEKPDCCKLIAGLTSSGTCLAPRLPVTQGAKQVGYHRSSHKMEYLLLWHLETGRQLVPVHLNPVHVLYQI